MGGQGGHMADSCTPDWRSYLEQHGEKAERSTLQAVLSVPGQREEKNHM